jgi:hypothetical protein
LAFSGLRDQATELQYLIKSETESYERNVPESMLTSDLIVEHEQITPKQNLPQDAGHKH